MMVMTKPLMMIVTKPVIAIAAHQVRAEVSGASPYAAAMRERISAAVPWIPIDRGVVSAVGQNAAEELAHVARNLSVQSDSGFRREQLGQPDSIRGVFANISRVDRFAVSLPRRQVKPCAAFSGIPAGASGVWV